MLSLQTNWKTNSNFLPEKQIEYNKKTNKLIIKTLLANDKINMTRQDHTNFKTSKRWI